MKTQKVKCLGVEVQKEVPSTLPELAKMGLSEVQVCEIAVKHILYHVFLGEVREKVQELIEGDYKDSPSLHRDFTFAKNSKGEETKTKVYSQTVEKWLESLIARGELTEKDKAEYVKLAVEEVEFKASSPREKKDHDLERRLELVKKMRATGPEWQEKFAKKCERNEVELGDEFNFADDNAVAAKILEIELAI